MEAPLTQLRRINTDTFYDTLRRLTNRQLNDLCLHPDYNFCNDKTFWENLWYRRNKTKPPTGTLKEIRQAYEEENLLESLVEEIYQNRKLSRVLHRRLYIDELPLAHYYSDNIEDYGDEVADSPQRKENRKHFDVEVENDFRKNWSRDRIRYILTKRDDEILKYAHLLFQIVAEFKDSELLRYLLLNSSNIIGELYDSSDRSSGMIRRILGNLRPFSRLPFIRNSSLNLIISLAVKLCNSISTEIIDAYFEIPRNNNYINIRRTIFSPLLLREITGCPEVRRAFANAILKLSKDEIKEIKELDKIKNSSLKYDLLDKDEIESILIQPNQRDSVIRQILTSWKIDRADLLSELMEKEEWSTFERILTIISQLADKENNDDRDLYQLYFEFLDNRLLNNERKEYLELLFLESLHGDYLFKAIQNSIKNGFPLERLVKLFESRRFQDLTDEQWYQIQDLIK